MTQYTRTEQLVYRLLLLDPPVQQTGEAAGDSTAERAFGFSLVFSAVRCILQYVVLPFVLPLVGIAGDAAVPVMLAINVVAVVAILFSIRRLWRINYKHKWSYLGVGLTALAILTAFLVYDLAGLGA